MCERECVCVCVYIYVCARISSPFIETKCYHNNCSIQLLGVYTFTRKVTLDEFETKPRKTPVSYIGMLSIVHLLNLHHYCRGMQPFPTSTVFTMNVTRLLSSEYLQFIVVS